MNLEPREARSPRGDRAFFVMAFTSDDLTKVETAIRKVRDGLRLVSLTLSDRIERRTDVTLKELLDLRNQILEEIGASQTDVTKRRPRMYRSRHSKGL